MATALVTGTSSGIGLATAVSLARAGHVVAATMRNLDRAWDLRQIVAKEQLAVDIEALDVDDDASVPRPPPLLAVKRYFLPSATRVRARPESVLENDDASAC
jgi:NAD(P)-dependent dehydrogenase (short-subunit alcohol dehydrogenase family)